jgi:putative FmdB family regulatory protein
MPTYTYACKQCAHRFDQRQSFSEEALKVCPQCAGDLRKVLNSVGVVFKGSGFYRTDSRNASATGAKARGSRRESAAPAAGPKPEGGSKSESSQPAKPAETSTAGSKKPAPVAA